MSHIVCVYFCIVHLFSVVQELICLTGNETAYKELGSAMVQFAKHWVQFVLGSCEKGRGTRPRWATAGLDFVTVVCHPLLLMELIMK